LAYWLKDILFVKYAEYDSQASYPDYGSSSECYINSQFWNWKLSPLQEIQLVIPSSMLRRGSSFTHLTA